MRETIFKSKESFKFMDFSISHQRLLIRATIINKNKNSFHNVDIFFLSTYFISSITTFMEGIEIIKGTVDIILNEENIELLSNEYYLILSGGKKFYIGARAIEISENTINPMVSSMIKN